MDYDYLIVGAGLFGCVFAHEAYKKGKKCLVIDKRKHIGGNTYCENVDGINVHKYGAHIFHTNDEKIWNYVNQFVPFNNYINSPLANYKGKLYNLPFNMNTFYQVWGEQNPQKVKEIIESQKLENNKKPKNLEEQAISLVGKDIYEMFIKGYTEKQWGRACTELPAFIIKRLPVRFTFNNNYFKDKYQGIPEGGYNILTNALLSGIDVKTNVDFFENRKELSQKAHKIVFTGLIDQFYDYKYGSLSYRSLRFEDSYLEIDNYQGNAVVNFTDLDTPHTRILEHKHFEFGQQKHTVITKEYPQAWNTEKEPYYPINDQKNSEIYSKYEQLAKQEQNVIFGGRLAEYRYYDMHQVVAASLKKVKQELNTEE